MKGSLIIVGFFVLGALCGVYHLIPYDFTQSKLSFYALCALMFSVGVSVGNDPQTLRNFRYGDPTLPHYRGAGDVDYAALAEDLPRLTNEGAALTQALFDHYKALVELRRAGRYAEAVELMRGAVEAAEGDE